MWRHLFSLILVAFALNAGAATVAFLELRDENGNTIQLEPGGRFGHVAIWLDGMWLHAHPERGVDLVFDIEEYGYDIEILVNNSWASPTWHQAYPWLGKPFDMQYRWNCLDATYCSRLVAELLGVPPRPMEFKSEIWARHTHRAVGELGLSPDELYKDLLLRGFRPRKDCTLLLTAPTSSTSDGDTL
jgi:hypothetical protein